MMQKLLKLIINLILVWMGFWSLLNVYNQWNSLNEAKKINLQLEEENQKYEKRIESLLKE